MAVGGGVLWVVDEGKRGCRNERHTREAEIIRLPRVHAAAAVAAAAVMID